MSANAFSRKSFVSKNRSIPIWEKFKHFSGRAARSSSPGFMGKLCVKRRFLLLLLQIKALRRQRKRWSVAKRKTRSQSWQAVSPLIRLHEQSLREKIKRRDERKLKSGERAKAKSMTNNFSRKSRPPPSFPYFPFCGVIDAKKANERRSGGGGV